MSPISQKLQAAQRAVLEARAELVEEALRTSDALINLLMEIRMVDQASGIGQAAHRFAETTKREADNLRSLINKQ